MIFRLSLCVAALFAFSLISLLPATAATPDADREPDRPGSRIEIFEAIPTIDPATDSLSVHCTMDRYWCAQIRIDEQTGNPLLVLLDKTKAAETREIGRYPMRGSEGDDPLTLWAHIVRTPQADGRTEQTTLIGVLTHMQAMYSGGGASAERVSLIEVDRGYGTPTFKEVLSVPLNGSVAIRACFSEADFEDRAGACHDEYSFSAQLTLRDAKVGELQFDYATTARSIQSDNRTF